MRRIVVALDLRFYKSENKKVFAINPFFADSLWQRYLDVFEEVFAFARVSETEDTTKLSPMLNPRVKLIEIPDYRGSEGFIRRLPVIRKLSKETAQKFDIFTFRIPNSPSTLLWRYVVSMKKPYGVEVVGDVWESLSPRTNKDILRAPARLYLARLQKEQCKKASVAAYVTKYSLQKRYPPGGWSTHYSSIDLTAEAFASAEMLLTRRERLEKACGEIEKEWRLICAGSMAHLYKAQDVLIEAVAGCIRDGYKIRLNLLGDGKERAGLEELAKRLEIKEAVKFWGDVPAGDAVRMAIDESDIAVLPSRQEGLPRFLIEAMARGAPCIGSTTGGIPELLEPEFLVAPNDVEGLKKKIIESISSPKKLVSASLRNYEVSKEYRLEILRERRIEFYKRLLDASVKEEM